MLKRVVLPLFLVIALFALYLWAALSWNYSVGDRAGWVQKLSKKGWLCKTWEGELALVSLPGTTPEKFFFTIRDAAVADNVSRVMGKRVTLHYEEKVGLPGSCFGDTRHFVNKVTVSEEIPLAAGVMVQTPAAAASAASAAASAAP
ncbi:MAG TPA: hypothetical protein VK876_07720 [Rubrivivax sp.]|nr:hypothetical protein [Rubrivivax sp.]